MKAIFMSKSQKSLDTVYLPETRARLESSLEFIPQINSEAELDARADELCDVEIIFSTWGMLSLTSEQIEKYFPNLKSVYYGAGSVQAFARPFIKAGIAVHSAWAANAIPVAEFTVSEIILANKGYFQRFHRAANKKWINHDAIFTCPGNYKNKIGIIGVGMIGSLVAEMLKSYNFEVLAFDPFLPEEKAKQLDIEITTLEHIFSECTVISNHLANNAQTVGMLNSSLFSRMRPDAVFINTGRGAQVVEDDLIDALESEPYRVALLDVTHPEPPKKNSKLYTLDNVILTPHIAGSLGNEVARMGEFMCEEYERVARGEEPKWRVTEKMLETMA